MDRSALRRRLAAVCCASAVVAVMATSGGCGAEMADQPPAAATPATPGAASPAEGACAKDTDCKGDRICDHGSCVGPHQP